MNFIDAVSFAEFLSFSYPTEIIHVVVVLESEFKVCAGNNSEPVENHIMCTYVNSIRI